MNTPNSNKKMLLYELTCPVEHKYGGVLTEEQAARCTRQTELDSPRWAPYEFRQPHVENLCGKFVVRVERAAESTATEPGNGSAPLVEEVESLVGLRRSSSAPSDAASGRSADGLERSLARCTDTTSNTMSNTTSNGTLNLPIYTSCLNNQQVTVDRRLSSVCFKMDSPFGRQQELFHLEGHVTVRCTPGLPRSMIFKGVKGVASIANLSRDLFFDQDPFHCAVLPLVHMGVVSSCMGLRLQTSRCCYLENRVLEGPLSKWMTVEARTPDQCNIVRLSVTDWSGLLPADAALNSLNSLTPSANDIVITSKGSVVHRLSWTGLLWDDYAEREILGACGRVMAAIASVC